MGKKMTQKQLNNIKKDCKHEISGINIDLQFSIKLLEDYKSDLDIERKLIAKTIKKAKAKYKIISLKLEEHNKALIDRLNKES